MYWCSVEKAYGVFDDFNKSIGTEYVLFAVEYDVHGMANDIAQRYTKLCRLANTLLWRGEFENGGAESIGFFRNFVLSLRADLLSA